MAVYLVSYDLNRRKDYARLINRIKQYRAYAQVLYSQWLVQTDGSSKDVATDLVKYIDNDDAILVSELTQTVSWRNLVTSDENMNKWVAASKVC